jgi:hypothetical protein
MPRETASDRPSPRKRPGGSERLDSSAPETPEHRRPVALLQGRVPLDHVLGPFGRREKARLAGRRFPLCQTERPEKNVGPRHDKTGTRITP